MQQIRKQFLIKYQIPFFFAKFALNKNIKKLFLVKFIRYGIDVNKHSILNIFLTFLLLFGQLPKINFYTKQITDKITHSSLIITQTFSQTVFYLYKVLNFFLLSSPTDLHLIKKKINTILLKDNCYYSELSYFPRFFVNLFNISIHVEFCKSMFISTYEKVTIFRLLQLPVNLTFAQQKKRKRFIYKKLKINNIK